MGTAPVWFAAAVGQPAAAGQVNQFLTYHNSTMSYGSAITSSETIGDAIYQETYDQQLAQMFTTTATQTSVTLVEIQLSTIGGSPLTSNIAPITVSLVEDSFGSPTGTTLSSAVLNSAYVYSSPFWVTVAVSASGLTPSTTYWIVLSMAGDVNGYYVWQQSNQGSGGLFSTDGFTWNSGGFGLMYRVSTQATEGSGQPTIIVEDDGNRVTNFTYDVNGNLTNMLVTTVDSTGGSVAYEATISYSNGLITGAS